jgi:RNA polymerase sigma-70 factor (ECF subfamily)
MTFASTSTSFTGHTSTATAVSKPSHILRRTKRIAQSRSCKPVRQESHNLAETRTGVVEMEAFHEMFVTLRPRFVTMAHAILRNREDAEDAVQNAFLLGHRQWPCFAARPPNTTWFTRIVLNASLMIQRKHKLSRIRPLPETISREANWTERIPNSQPDPEMVHAERETLQFINGVLAKMKPALRQAFTMTYYDELSGAEACAVLGVSAGTFKARLFRARRQLLNQAQQALVAPIRRANPSPFLPDRTAVQHLVARPLDTSSLEASYS